jgi:fructose-specific phosphotransferase system IIA component
MMVNLKQLFSPDVLLIGSVYAVTAFAAKLLGCGIPAMFLNFNKIGALRIGMGMVPRGEVALIISGIGLAMGLIDEKLFSASIIMTLITTLIAPPILSKLLLWNKVGTKKQFKTINTVTTTFNFANIELNELLTAKVLQAFKQEGYYVHAIHFNSHSVHQLKRDNIIMTMTSFEHQLDFQSDGQDVVFIKSIVHEALVQVNDIITHVKDLIKPEVFLKDITESKDRSGISLRRVLDSHCIIPHLKSQTKDDVIKELVELLCKNDRIQNKEDVLEAVFKREQSMSTGMQYGIALPHAKTTAVSKEVVAIGISQAGIDFQSIDGAKSHIFVLILSPADVAAIHIRLLAAISAVLNNPEVREQLLKSESSSEIWEIMTQKS